MMERLEPKMMPDILIRKMLDKFSSLPTNVDLVRNTYQPAERILSPTEIAELSRLWGEKSTEWKNQPPSAEDLFQMLSDVIDMRSSLGLTNGPDREIDISTGRTRLIVSKSNFLITSLRITATETENPSLIEHLLLIKYPAVGEFPPYVEVSRSVELGQLSYVSPSTDSEVEFKPAIERGLSGVERAALAEKIWNGHLLTKIGN